MPMLMHADFVFAARCAKSPLSDDGCVLRNFARAWSFLTMLVPVALERRTKGRVTGEALLICVALGRSGGCARLGESTASAEKATSTSFATIVGEQEISRRGCRCCEALLQKLATVRLQIPYPPTALFKQTSKTEYIGWRIAATFASDNFDTVRLKREQTSVAKWHTRTHHTVQLVSNGKLKANNQVGRACRMMRKHLVSVMRQRKWHMTRVSSP